MDRKKAPKESYFRYPVEQIELRGRQRLKRDLGLSDEAIEVIMNLRHQLLSVQARLREVETELEIQRTGQSARLARYRQVSYDVVWQDMVED
jgi:hypothetical protein